jgi:hypothetical protein
MSSNYVPYVSKTALDSMPLTLPGVDVSQIFTGSDSAATVNAGVQSEPKTQDKFTAALEGALQNNLYVPLELGGKTYAANPNTGVGGVLNPNANSIAKPIIYAALFVVIGLLIISRGFGMIGEEGSDLVVNLANPEKFPGVGHAIQGIRKRK